MQLTSMDRVKGAFGTSCTHSIRLSGARLPVCENGNIVTLDEGIDAVADIFPNTLLGRVLAENAVKDEQLLPLVRLNGEIGGRRDIAGRSAETLGDQVVARVSWLERRAHSNGYTPVSGEGR